MILLYIYICDDWNWTDVKEGTYKAIDERFNVLYKKEITCDYDRERHESWWNGILITVLQKK